MSRFGNYLLVPLLSILLVTAQAFWASAIKTDDLLGHGLSKTISGFVSNPKIWIGGFLYIGATSIYFLLLSKYKFFSVQIGMTALAIIFSTLLSALLFHEKLSAINLAGMFVVLAGLSMVISR